MSFLPLDPNSIVSCILECNPKSTREVSCLHVLQRYTSRERLGSCGLPPFLALWMSGCTGAGNLNSVCLRLIQVIEWRRDFLLNWWKRRKYRSDVMSNLMAMTLMLGDEGKLLEAHEGIAEAIEHHFEEGLLPEASATYLAATFISDAIARSDDFERKQSVERALSEWSALDVAEQRQTRAALAEGSLDQDMLLTRCQWMLLFAQDYLIDKKIDTQIFRILKDSIYGPLKGETIEQRTSIRLSEILDQISDS